MFSKWKSIPSLGVLPKVCVSKKPLPRDSWDIPFDGWINEEEFFDPLALEVCTWTFI